MLRSVRHKTGPRISFVSFYCFAVRFDPLTHNVATLLHFHAKMLKTFRLSLLGGRLPFSARCLLHLSFLTHLVLLEYVSAVPLVKLIAQTSYPYDDDEKDAEGQMGKVSTLFIFRVPFCVCFMSLR